MTVAAVRRPIRVLLSLSLALWAAGCRGCGSKPVVLYDLALRTVVAERWSARDVILFGTPAAEPHQAAGFFREAAAGEGERFLWTGAAAEVSLSWREAAPRAAVVDLAPYAGVKAQRAEVRLNGTPVGGFALNDARHRYLVALPASAQRAGENRLAFAFSQTASPADQDPRSGDRRRLAAAFYSLMIGRQGDAGLEDLLRREAPRPFAVTAAAGAPPALVQVGPSVVRYAIRVPAGGELRFTPELHPAARAAAGAASFRVTLESAPGQEREAWGQVVRAQDPAPGEVALALPGAPGAIVRIGLHVGGAPDGRFAWGIWKAPRVLGAGAGGDAPEAAPLQPRGVIEGARALRRELAGSNVLLVVLDAARARQFGCYGYGAPTTPEVDRIAAEGVVFDGAFTPAVYTLGAMSSVWTSQQPDRHHSEVSFSARLPGDRLTLAELLAARGIHAAGFVANAVAGTAFGFERGFTEFHETFRRYGSAAAGFREVLPGWLKANRGRRFFAYVHFREPHFPYDPPAPFRTRFGPDQPLSPAARRDQAFFTDVNQGRRRFSPAEAAHLVRLYDGNLAYADQELGVLRRAMEAEGLWEKTVVIVAADHGEALYEHGWIGHNVQLYDESIRVPLIVRVPKGKGPAGARIAGLTDLLDLAPTVADVFGIEPEALAGKFEGHSLLPLIAGGEGKSAVLSRTVWDRPIYALRDRDFKYLYDTRTGEEKLFDLESDSDETRDVRGAQPLRAAYYRESLHLWIARLGRKAAGAAAARIGREQCENLKGLGYLAADHPCPPE